MAPEQAIRQPELHQVQASWSPYARLNGRLRIRLRQLWSWLGFGYDTATAVRYEVDMLMLRARCAISLPYRRRVRALCQRNHLLVHLGCGNALLPGWVNLDCYPPERRPNIDVLTLDLRRRLPFADASVAAVFSEHFLEHLPFEIVRSRILPEILRALEPGGCVRLAVPDGEYFIGQYVTDRAGNRDALFDQHRSSKTTMMMLNDVAHGYGHHFLYDFATLAQILEEVGFVDVRRANAGSTDNHHFKGLDRLDEWRVAMSLYVEARAPGHA